MNVQPDAVDNQVADGDNGNALNLHITPMETVKNDGQTMDNQIAVDMGNEELDQLLVTKKAYKIDYETGQWVFIIGFTLITVVDRFTINLWPLWVDSPGPIVETNIGVTCFALIAWVTSRMMLVSSSYIFLFQCRVFWNWFSENKTVNKYVEFGTDINEINMRLHYYVGVWFIGVPVMLHVWSILWAAWSPFDNNSINFYDTWMRPEDPKTGLSIEFYADNLLSLAVNDVYRLVSTTFCFAFLFPLSVCPMTRNLNWSFAQWLHLLAACIYTIDLIRMHSHPHCWFFNVPFIAFFMIDRLYGIFWYRRCIAKAVAKVQLDPNYMVVYLRIPDEFHGMYSIGDIYYLNVLGNCRDRAHPFTVFQNHKYNKPMYNTEKTHLEPDWSGHKFKIKSNSDLELSQYVMSRQSTNMTATATANHFPLLPVDEEIEDHGLLGNDGDGNNNNNNDSGDNDHSELEPEIVQSNDWNVGVVINVRPDHTTCNKRKTWTNLVYQLQTRFFCGLRCWGPYRSQYQLLLTEYKNKYPLILIGTGAGCPLLIDYYSYIALNGNRNDNNNNNNSIQFYFSTRSVALFQWFTDITCSKNIPNLKVNAHLTSHDNIVYFPNQNKSRDSKIGRLSFEELLNSADPNTMVFFCGGPRLQSAVGKLCAKLNLKYHAGHAFNS